jgi:two-component system chemotaxis sensor kinase CheA
MTIEVDDDVKSDFLVEAGEIVHRLGGELLDLEQRPSDKDLLNQIFRGFHTIKGGAGFLRLQPVVDLCHQAEETFNALRNGKLVATAQYIDHVVQSVNLLERMLDQVKAGEEPDAAPPELLAALKGSDGKSAAPPPAPPAPAKEDAAAAFAAKTGAITDDEFEALLDELQGGGAPKVDPPKVDPPKVEPPKVDPPKVEPPKPKPEPKGEAKAEAKPAAETTVRVDTIKLDRIMNLVGELVLVRNRLKLLRGKGADPEVEGAVTRLDQVATGLQASVMQLRMQPVGKVFSRFPRLAREVATSLGKKVELVFEGEKTDLDKNLVEALADPLIHLVRNAIDHGIEKPDVRAQRGKRPEGHLLLSAAQEGDRIVITVRDDGAGMDPEILRRKAVEKGVLNAQAASRLTPAECLELIFAPGFSTKAEVSEVSGRGVGMDVVKSRITELKGAVHLDSSVGVGTTVRISVPLTLAILPVLMVRCARTYAIPLSLVHDVFQLDPSQIVQMDGRPLLPRKNDPLPLVFLDRWLGLDEMRPRPAQPLVVNLRASSRDWGLVVDEVRGREEIVVKPLGALLNGVPGYSGATVTADGTVALILDIPGLLKSAK